MPSPEISLSIPGTATFAWKAPKARSACAPAMAASRVAKLDGQLEATSGDGHINVEGRFDGLSIKTGDGSVTARANPGSKLANGWNVHTGDGSVTMSLPGDLQANIDASN